MLHGLNVHHYNKYFKMHEAKQRKYFKKQIARIMETQFNALQVNHWILPENFSDFAVC